MFFVIITTIFFVKIIYNRKQKENSWFLEKVNIEKETQHSEDILGMLVPKFVQKQMQNRKFTIQKP